ncbi:MAG: hypothetical protein G8345_08335 [Magnetococcales bacterium]|nr:hypothetical protein [Magnetococcales bacterium]
MEQPSHATVSTPYRVYILPSGQTVTHQSPLLLADHTDLSIQWQSNRMLAIFYKDIRIYQFASETRVGEGKNSELVELFLVNISETGKTV